MLYANDVQVDCHMQVMASEISHTRAILYTSEIWMYPYMRFGKQLQINQHYVVCVFLLFFKCTYKHDHVDLHLYISSNNKRHK